MNIEVNIEERAYEMKFITARRLKHYKGENTYPLTTQCVIKERDFVVGVGTVALYTKDVFDSLVGKREAFKKASVFIEDKRDRTILYNSMMEMHERLQKVN